MHASLKHKIRDFFSLFDRRINWFESLMCGTFSNFLTLISRKHAENQKSTCAHLLIGL